MFMHMFMSYFEHIKPNEVYTYKKFKDKLGPPKRVKHIRNPCFQKQQFTQN